MPDDQTSGRSRRSGSGGPSAGEPIDTEAEEVPSDSSGGPGRRSPLSLTIWERLSDTFLKPPKPPGPQTPAAPDDVSRMSDEEKRALITNIDPLERKIGLAASAFAAVLAVAINVTYMLGHFAVPIAGVTPKNGHCPNGLTYVKAGNTCNGVYTSSHYVIPLVIGLVLAVAIFVTVRIGRRAPVAFAIAITGVALGSLIEMIPFILVAGWLLLRSYRVQKNGSPTAKAPLPGWVPPPRPTRGGKRPTATRSPARSTATSSAKPRTPPSANKRYTPKAPPKKKAASPVASKPASKANAKSKTGASEGETKDS